MIMTNNELVRKARQLAGEKTLYVMGAFGAPSSPASRARYTRPDANEYNLRPTVKPKILAAPDGTWFFDCVGVIKGLLWGFDFDKTATYGGAVYASAGVPDTNAEGMIARCEGVNTNFADILPGEMLWKEGHCGIYIGSGHAVECTPSWANCVQITDVANILSTGDRPARTWTKHGRLPWIRYDPEMPFVDVKPGSWYYDAVAICYNAGLMIGTDATHFNPNGTVTRAQLATVIAKLMRR